MLSRPIENFITVGDIETHLRVGGDGEPLLFLHGHKTADLWLPFEDELAKEYKVYVPDHPGFGRSSLPGWVDSMEDFVIHYARLLDELKLNQINLVGISFGGWLAAEFASFFPERVKKLVLIDSYGLRVAGAPTADLFAYPPEQFNRLCFVDPDKAVIKQDDNPDPATEFSQDYRERATMALLAWQKEFNPKLPYRLRRVTSPTLIIWGEKDALIPLSHGEAYRAAIANAQLEVVPDSGHFPIIEQALHTARLISNFLGKGEN
jgi:pimeloyl-ACP methyl ester carboxylesterase